MGGMGGGGMGGGQGMGGGFGGGMGGMGGGGMGGMGGGMGGMGGGMGGMGGGMGGMGGGGRGGAGQGGGKLAETFSQIGYARVGVINTADQDLATINVPNKMKFGEQQGAGKNREFAKQAFLNSKEDVVDSCVTV